METQDAALAAMESLDDQHVFDASGTALSLNWGDPELSARTKKAMEDANNENRMLFFAKVLRSTTEDQVRQLFGQFGKVQDINMFRAFQGAPTTKGCGLVTMASHPEAVAAIEALDGKFVWEGMDCPMVVKWMDTALQRRRREQHLSTARQPLPSTSIVSAVPGVTSVPPGPATSTAPNAPTATFSPPSVISLGMPHTVQAPTRGLGGMGSMGGAMGTVGGFDLGAPGLMALGGGGAPGMLGGGGGLVAAGYGGGDLLAAGGALLKLAETPPPGCDPDAMKLFVGNIPKTCTEEQLLPLFQSVGKVVELVIVYDKITHESKGSAFVWYATRAEAERAILQFNLRHVFPDPSGAQDRPLVVRRAKARSRVGPPGAGYMGLLGQDVGMGSLPAYTPYYPSFVTLGQQQPAQQLAYGGQSVPYVVYGGAGAVQQQQGALSMASLQAGLDGLSLVDSMRSFGLGGGGLMQQQQQQQQRHPQAQLVGGGAAGGVVYDPYGAEYGLAAALPGGAGGGYRIVPAGPGGGVGGGGAPGGGGGMGGGAGSRWGGGGGDGGSVLTLALNQQQLSAVNAHLFSVQTVSGAQLQLTPGASGLFHLSISGGKAQVDAARSLVATVLQA